MTKSEGDTIVGLLASLQTYSTITQHYIHNNTGTQYNVYLQQQHRNSNTMIWTLRVCIVSELAGFNVPINTF